MKKMKTATSETAKNTLRKILEDQKIIAAYFKGEISISEVKAKGIRFVTPV